MNTGKFIQIPNVAFGFGTDYKLNDDELKVYAYLQWMKNVGTMNIRTHVTIIVEDLGWTTTNASRDNTRVANALEKLASKGYINLSFNGEIKKNALAIEINEEMKKVEAESTVDWKQNPFKFSGYTEINRHEYNLAGESDYHLTICAYHNWRTNAKFEYSIADQEWAEVLELGVKRTREIIDDCASFITKISGGYYKDDSGQWKQETNKYVKTVKVKTNVKEIEQTNKNMTILEREWEKVTDEEIKYDSDVFNQIFDKKTPMEFKGYKAWKETSCEHVKSAGQKKYDAVAKSPKEGAKYVIQKWEREYSEYLHHKEQQERMINKHMEDLESQTEPELDYEEKVRKLKFSKRKEKEVKKDISAFLD